MTLSIFDRLCGLETEYALRLPADSPHPSRFRLYQQLIGQLAQRVLTVEARHFKDGVFLANGGAVWFDGDRPAAGGGLIEGATPECRGPRELMLYQQAQDQLLEEAARAASIPFTLIKNDRDAAGNVYGAQENYECRIASGWRLVAWRVGLVLLVPLVLLWWLAFLGMFLGTLVYLLAATLLFIPLRRLSRRPSELAARMFGRDRGEGDVDPPVWMESALLGLTRLASAPLAMGLWLLSWLTAFNDQRDGLLPFLISRSVIAGAGMVDDQGRFLLADKAPSVNCILGIGRFLGDRPIIMLGHFFKTLYAETLFVSPHEYLRLFSARQRLQIGLGDSNMSPTAEFVKLGATLLVLDAAEAGFLRDAPRLSRPVRVLHEFCRDTSLRAEAVDRQGRAWTALDLQRYYLNACSKLVDEADSPPAEAREVLLLWERTLELLEDYRDRGERPAELLAAVDWSAKKWLLDGAASDAEWAERKKLDIRYHEMSPEGYFRQLAATGLVEEVVAEDDVERAVRTPPADSPATARSRFIREFANGDEPVSANWRTVVIGAGMRAKVIRLDDYARRT